MDDIDGLLLTALNFETVSETSSFSVTAPTTENIATGSARNFFLCNATSGAIVASLPAANAVWNGFTVAFKKSDSSVNAVTITPNGSDTIDLAATLVIASQNDSYLMASDGISNWNIIAYKHGSIKSFSMNVQEFTTPGSFTYIPTAGMVNCIATIAGGGGGGGGVTAQGQGAPGGGAAAIAIVLLTAAQIGTSITGSIGAGGTAGDTSSGTGGNGGTTSLGSLVSCLGGIGGAAGSTSPNIGGIGGNFTITTGTRLYASVGQVGGAGGPNFGGAGADCPGIGVGGAANSTMQAALVGLIGTGYGASGSGSVNVNSSNQSGGSGAPGIVTIIEYIYA